MTESEQMPAEPTAAQLPGTSRPPRRSSSIGAYASRARLEQTAAFLAPVALIGGLALAGGGFDVSGRHIAGLAAWLVVVALLVFGAASATTLARPLYGSIGLIGGLAL